MRELIRRLRGRHHGADGASRASAALVHPDASLRPLLLVHPSGRTGTTLLMQILATSRHIVFERVYPFETRYLAYLLRWATLLERTGRSGDDWSAAAITRLEPDAAIGPLPYPHTTLWDGDAMARAGFTATWGAFSRVAAARWTTTGGAEARYYAEKVPPWVPRHLRRLLPCDVLVLVRDPRDVFVSIAAFDARRGFPGFSRRADEDDWTFARRWVELCRERYAILREEARTPGAVLVRYEDLITDLDGQAHRLAARLGTPLEARAVAARVGDFSYHITSQTPAASVGRWRREMPPELAAFLTAELQTELAQFGYGQPN